MAGHPPLSPCFPTPPPAWEKRFLARESILFHLTYCALCDVRLHKLRLIRHLHYQLRIVPGIIWGIAAQHYVDLHS